MPNKKHAPKSKHRTAKHAPKVNNIQAVGLVVIFLAVAAIIWGIVSTQPKKKSLQYTSAPAMQIDTQKLYTATFKMAKGGEFVVQLYADKAPITVNSFVFLARQGFYDGVTFHRVLEGFMAQGEL